MKLYESDVDKLSNKVVDLINEKKFKEAKKVCKLLEEKFPNQVDKYNRLAEVFKAEGNREEAIKYFNKTIEFMKEHSGFDEESIKAVLKEMEMIK